MNKQTKKTNKTGRIALLIIVLAIILALLNPAVLTFLPLGIREYLAQFSATYFSKSIVSGITLEAVAAAVLAMVITWLAGDLVKNLTESFHSQRHRSETIRHLIGSILKYVIYIIGFVVALGCLGVDAAAMFVSAGVVGIVVGFGAQSLIEDVITAGTAVREVLPQLKAAADVKVEHMIISVDRMERGQGGTTAIKEIGREFGIAVHPIVTVREIIDHMYGREVNGVVLLNDEMKEKMEAYLAQYCEV